MQFEQCEIRANRYGSLIVNHEFVAEGAGPHGSYVVARAPQFGAYEPTLKHLFFYPRHGVDQPDDTPYQRRIFNVFADYLVSTGWEPLAESGVYWFSRRFRRPVSRSLPDPEPATPYTLGDLEAWQEKTLKAFNQYQQQKDPQSCRKRGEALLQLGLAFERRHQFTNAGDAYFRAGHNFEEIGAIEEAAKAYQQAERVLP
jgi:tetratricopeptide (TPR) repeat protein